MPLVSLICDTDVTPAVLATIDTLDLEHQALVMRGVRLDPAGDQIQIQIHRDQIDQLVLALSTPELHERVDVLLQPSEDLIERSQIAPEEGDEDVAVWAQVRDDIVRQGRLSWINVLLLVVAAMIAAIGIMENQILLIVGAMAISPDYFIVALPCLAAVWGRWRAMARGLAAIVVAFAAGAAGALALSLALGLSGLVSPEDNPARDLVGFIVHPDAITVIVALLAGIAGGLAITLADGRGLVGVFVSITTIPAAANIGVALAAGRFADMGGAAAQLGANLAALMTGVCLTLLARRLAHARTTRSLPGPGAQARGLAIP